MGVFDKFTNEKATGEVYEGDSDASPVDIQNGVISENKDDLQRRLGNRQIQLLAIGGSIGTALFVSIGGGLQKGGPGSLFLAYTIYSAMLGLVNNCIAEMTGMDALLKLGTARTLTIQQS